MGDLLHSPTCRSQGEDVADSGLIDHLLIELADASPRGMPTGRIALTNEEHSEQSSIGNRAAGGHGEPLRSRTGDQHAGVAMPDQRGLSSANSSLG
jgi:hypothetical protein